MIALRWGLAILLVLSLQVTGEGQTPRLGKRLRQVAERLPDSEATLHEMIEGEPPLYRGLEHAAPDVPFLDLYTPVSPYPLSFLSRDDEGAFVLPTGTFALYGQSFFLKSGTYGSPGGRGYSYAPLEGKRAPIIQALLRRSVEFPEV